MESTDSVSLGNVVHRYLGNLKSASGYAEAQQELFRFVQWFGRARAVPNLKPFEIKDYAEQIGGSGVTEHATERLREVRKFLSFARKNGLTEQNLAHHLRIPKSGSRTSRSLRGGERETVELTAKGYSQLSSELEKLKGQRGPIALQIRQAAADKDVRENVPLEAAREQLGYLESRIRQIEETLKRAVIIDSSRPREGQVAKVGSKVALKDLDSERQVEYTVVSATEANPLEGKISDVSPVGKALVGGTAGLEIDVVTPRGSLRYRILRVSL